MPHMSDEEFAELYGRPPVRTSKSVKRKIYWNRIVIALVLLILLIFGIVQLVRSLTGSFKNDDKTPAAAVQSSSESADTESEASKPEQLQFKVCIDAGHGDYDGGTASPDGTRIEKDDDLKIALAVQKYLEDAGVTVVMVRSDDTFVDLAERCEIANDSKSDLYVSLHRNSYDGDMSGVEIWVHNKEPKEDTLLAQNILDKLSAVGISRNRGVNYGYIGMTDENYYVNADTNMPSCLVELGFITDDTDNKLFDDNLEEYAEAISEGIIQTAKDLGVIDDQGKRILNQQLISKDKIQAESQTDSSDESSDASSRDFPDDGHLAN